MSLLKDIKGSLTFTVGLKSQAITTTTNGTGVDLQQYVGIPIASINCAAATAGSSPTMDIKIQDSADNSTFADVSPAIAATQVTTVDSIQQLAIDKRVVRRYIRAVATIGGTSSPSFPVSVVIIGEKQVEG
jgi:hypothetical protein